MDDCVREYGDLIWRLAVRYLGSSGAETQDAVQEVFIEIWLAAARFDPALGQEASFVATLAHRRLIDHRRRLTARARATEGARRAADRVTSRDALDLSESPSELAEAFNDLPDAERHALWLVIHGGLSHREIAEATSAPIGTVKSRLRRAAHLLASALGGKAAAKGGAR